MLKYTVGKSTKWDIMQPFIDDDYIIKRKKILC